MTASAPTVSILLAVSEPSPDELRNAIDSVRNQTSGAWELYVVDTSPEPVLDALTDTVTDARMRVVRAHDQDGLGGAMRQAVDDARAPFLAFLGEHDALHADAVAHITAAIAAHDDLDYLYTDEDEIDAHARHSNPFYKPDWSPERLRCQPYALRLAVMRRDTVESVGGIRPEFGNAYDYDLALRVTESARAVIHLPEVLYHRRVRPPVDAEPGRRAVAAALERTNSPATVEPHPLADGVYRLQARLREQPLVSIVIPTAGGSRRIRGGTVNLVVNCVESIVQRSTYQNYEIVCVSGSRTPDTVAPTLATAAGKRLRLVDAPEPFNFSRAINVGAIASRGHYLLALNDDTEVLSPDWIESLLMYACDEGVGAVGAKLSFGDGRLQHVGVVGVAGSIGHPYYEFPADHRGHHDNTIVAANFLAVTAACMMSRRVCFESVGGFSLDFPLNYNDIDYCLKLRQAGYRIVWTPEAHLSHFETSTRGVPTVADDERERILERWGRLLERDPYYNPNFLRSSGDFAAPIYLEDGRRFPSPTADVIADRPDRLHGVR